MRCALPFLLPALFALLAGCDQDPFGFSRRTIRGEYQLEQWEDFTTYYLQVAGVDSPTGFTEGAVDRIGWNERYILARHVPAPGADREEWFIVDMADGSYTGPLATGELGSEREYRGIVARPAGEAWKSLPFRPLSRVFLIFAAVFAIGFAAAMGRAVARALRRAGRSAEPA
jgi:hypothetical protein